MSSDTKPPLVALHGFLGCAADWEPLFEDLRRDRMCIAIGLPGHGNQPAPPPGQGLQAVAEQLLEATDGLGVVDYLGYSMGGRMLYQLATDPRVLPWRRMVLVGAHPGIEGEAQRETRRLKDEWLARELEERDFEAFLDDWYEQPLFGAIKQASGYPQMIQRRLGNEPHAMAQALRQLGTGVLPSCWHDLRDIDQPVLLAAGGRDEKYRALNRRAAKHMRRAQVAELPGAGHAPQIEVPGDVAALVRRFLGV